MNRPFTNLSDIFGEDSYHSKTTSLNDLIGYDEPLPKITFNDSNHARGRPHSHGEKSIACKIRCTDILEHITTCPVCSKLYKPTDNEQYHDKPVVNKNIVCATLLIGILLIIIILLLKIVLTKN